ncbi:EutN/CcmL family microcompartment protein [Nocardia jiangxiensis]|uniref:EutN/CcmL family microcompartment protein n=1 Tax=Nocardia jiangxiensis TaxID=282685 RepID=UPI00059510F7|nr:EutN/CcmL family microcompartment protein [Nocardia jiangxiensis]
MRLARVVGQVVSTAKVSELAGTTILLLEPLENTGSDDSICAAVDLIGAGIDEVVLVTTGSAARVSDEAAEFPIDAAIVAIADTVVVHGTVTYSK